MKKLILGLIIVFSISPEMQASHSAGGSIWYTYIGDSTGIPYNYRIRMDLLRRNELTSVSYNNSYPINITSSCYNDITVTLQRKTPPSHLDAGDGGFLPNPNSNCSNGNTADSSFNNISIHRYEGSIILPGLCMDFNFSFKQCCLPNVITNLVNPAGNYLYLDSDLNNTFGPNSSPRFETSPMLVYCINQPALANYSAIEPDGDSLFYSLAKPWTDRNQIIPYDSLFTRFQPISSQSGVSFDFHTGVMQFTPSNIENDVIKVKVYEYRYDSILQARFFVGVTSRQIICQIVATCDTASFNWNLPKDSIGFNASIDPPCHTSTIKFKTDFLFLKSSLAADGSDFRLFDIAAGNIPVPITGAITNQNNSSLFADEVWLQLNQPINHDGEFKIVSRVGNDTNTIISLCGASIPTNDTVSFNVTNCNSNFGVGEHKLNNLHLYPSPAQNALTVELPLSQTLSNWKYTIYNIQGQAVSEGKFESNKKGAQTISVNELRSGLYTLRLANELKNTYSAKFVKK